MFMVSGRSGVLPYMIDCRSITGLSAKGYKKNWILFRLYNLYGIDKNIDVGKLNSLNELICPGQPKKNFPTYKPFSGDAFLTNCIT